ncbi:C40 family peptidase [Paenibacillus sepulcri]|uniref:C40 family peptidase n=1 Tax=Paenibacillus sepulcri TaxID=359917 RepID=A0ABS7C3C7_9BACL|nr:C40 family peptidase [Paenibacillus sepulcri]
MLRKQTSYRAALAVSMTILIAWGTGCAKEHLGMDTASAPGLTVRAANLRVANHSTFTHVPVYRETGGLVWIPLKESAASMSLDVHKLGGRLALGNTDAAYWLKVNDKQAFSGDNIITLPQAPKLFNGKPYVTTDALSSLLETPVNWNEKGSQIIITPIDDRTRIPLKQVAPRREQIKSFSVSVNKSDLIEYAKKYMGTPYDFGSSSYSETHKFDCSSFVQYVYGHFGIDLPRTAKEQSEIGQTVPASQLQQGDLMFFYTPGRFDTNRIVGHVGIYMGGNRIIQSYGDPGVTISEFDNSWKERFLFAKRVSG